ncbi:MAG: CoA-binding protein [Cyclobacteriaceae bacterium]|nr:CoA-binding protein [Cyclobacteriaceae bacterium]
MSKKTVVLGASTNPGRYSFMAAEMLSEYGHEVVPVGLRKGVLAGAEILDIRSWPPVDDVHTVTLYIGPSHQDGLLDYLTRLKPARVIFNPGTENRALEQALEKQGIAVQEACTLVMLRSGQY